MAKLCQACQNKQPDLTLRGTCQVPNFVGALATAVLPPTHLPWTASPNFTMCEGCADRFQLCQWCWGPLNGAGGVNTPTDKKFCVQMQNDDGNHVKGMNIGEQILAKLQIDLFSGLSWQPKNLSYGVRLANQRLVTDGGRYGWQELYFDLGQADPKAVIELAEMAGYNRWWAPPSSNKSWKITVEVRR